MQSRCRPSATSLFFPIAFVGEYIALGISLAARKQKPTGKIANDSIRIRTVNLLLILLFTGEIKAPGAFHFALESVHTNILSSNKALNFSRIECTSVCPHQPKKSLAPKKQYQKKTP
jgi:hypothetical protein